MAAPPWEHAGAAATAQTASDTPPWEHAAPASAPDASPPWEHAGRAPNPAAPLHHPPAHPLREGGIVSHETTLGADLLHSVRHAVSGAGGHPVSKHAWLNWFAGTGEAAWNFITGTAGAVEGGLAGAAAAGEGALWRAMGKPWHVSAAEAVRRTEGALTYTPHTKAGRRITGAVSLPFTLAGVVDEHDGDAVFRLTHNPLLATIAGVGLRAIAMLGGDRLTVLRARRAAEAARIKASEVTEPAAPPEKPEEPAPEAAPPAAAPEPPGLLPAPVRPVTPEGQVVMPGQEYPQAAPFSVAAAQHPAFAGFGELTERRMLQRYVEAIKTPKPLRSAHDTALVTGTRLTPEQGAAAEQIALDPIETAGRDPAIVPAETEGAQPIPESLTGDLEHKLHRNEPRPEAPLTRRGIFRRRMLPNVEHALRMLGAARRIDQKILVIDWDKRAREAGVEPEADAHVNDWIEDHLLPESERTLSLTPEEQQLYEAWYKPLLSELGALDPSGTPTGYLPRESVGKGGPIERLISGYQHGRLRAGVGLFRRTHEGMRHRVMMAITDESGHRTPVHVERSGRHVELHFYNGEHWEHLGRFTALSAQEALDRELAPIQYELRDLRSERDLLSRNAGSRRANARRLRTIADRIETLRAERDERRANAPFEGDGHIAGRNGRYQLGNATTREIEARTPVRYHGDLLRRLELRAVAERQVRRQVPFMDDLKEMLVRDGYATRDEAGAPQSWDYTPIPNFRGMKFEPYLAEALKHYWRRATGTQLRIPVLAQLNDLSAEIMFTIPFWHDANIAEIWTEARGVRGFTPAGVARFNRTTARAFHSMMTFDDKYLSVLAKGAPLKMLGLRMDAITPRAFGVMAEHMYRELASRDSLSPIREALGYAVPRAVRESEHLNALLRMGKWTRDRAHDAVWMMNDLAFLQRVYEHEELGMSEDQAIAQASRELVTYDLPQGYKALNALLHPDLTWFARYHFDIARVWGRRLRAALPGDLSLAQRAEAINQAAMGLLIAFVLYPQIDKAVRLATGNPRAHMTRFGLADLPYVATRIAESHGSPNQIFHVAARLFTPAPMTFELVQNVWNRQMYSGDPISPYYEPVSMQWKQRFLHALGNFNIPLSNYYEAHTAWQGLLAQFGVHLPDANVERAREDILKQRRKRLMERQYFSRHPDQ